MSRIYIEYLNGCFDEKDVAEISQIYNSYNVDVKLYERRPMIVNAALDELLETVLLFINSSELQTSIAIFIIASAISAVAKWMWNKLKSKRLKMVTCDTVEEIDAKIIVQVDNVKILLNKNISEEELTKYLHIALSESKIVAQEEKHRQIIIDGDNNTVNIYFLKEYAKKTIGAEHKSIRTVSYRKYGGRDNNAKIRRHSNGNNKRNYTNFNRFSFSKRRNKLYKNRKH